MLNPKIVVITGPTASGKTNLALKLAQKIAPASIISIDSRQVYQGLAIISGQDIPANFIKKNSTKLKLPYYTNGKTRLWAVNILPPTQDINVKQFSSQVFRIIKLEFAAKRNIILVGGSGLYLKAIVSSISTINIPPNPKLRANLGNKSAKQLQTILKKISPKKFNQLNRSDQNNPFRLIRAIEIAKANNPAQIWYLKLQKKCKFLMLGIKNPQTISVGNIRKRVIHRINRGAIDELKNILSNKNPSLSVIKTLGVKQITDYINKKITKKELITLWTQAECSYYKRQLVWFARQKQIIWYDANSKAKLINKAVLWLKNTNRQ